MTRNARRGLIAMLAAAAAALSAPALAAAAPDPGGFRDDDLARSSFNIVPPGQNGFESITDVTAFLANGTRPPHQYDQNDMYTNLVYATPGLKRKQILDYFKDASFGVRPRDVERTETPDCDNPLLLPPAPHNEHCGDVTIVRDQYGVPHIYGADRAALQFGIGYATAADRLFLADALRHAGRGQLSSFAGGANVGQDRDTFANSPYADDSELQAQFDRADELYGERGRQIQEDAQNYVDGFNQWIAETKLNPTKLDALYALTNHPTGPEPWKVTDIVATGALVAGIFGKGGGGELEAATSLQTARKVLGKRRGKRVWNDFRSADDPEAPTTVHRERFPYRTPPRGKRRGAAIPDPGSVRYLNVVAQPSGQPRSERDPGGELLEGLRKITAASNALVISARESRSGHPLAVFGPQTGYYAPQLLIEQDVHAPGGPEGPAIDARGVAFVGSNLYVQLGRGVDYAWSATSAGQDIIDTFAVPLCEPDGSEPTRHSRHYVFAGRCQPMEVIKRTNSWIPNLADQTPPGSETMRALRTKAGLVTATATIDGRLYAYTKLRATYKHEVDSAISFGDWNSPEVVHDARSWIKAGHRNDLTFNWFYVDDDHVAYYNSGANPQRSPRTHPNFPVLGEPRFMWRDYNARYNTFKREPFSRHPQVVDQRFLTSWNNKQARGYRCDGIRCYSPVYRVDSLDRKIRAAIKGKRRLSLPGLIDIMESAGTTDLRGLTVAPFALRVLKRGRWIGDARSRRAARTLRAWVRDGAHRLDHDDDGNYEHAEAIKIMDAWWPLWVRRQFLPTLGPKLNEILIGHGHAIHDAPGPIGSAFQNNVYGFVQKDLRQALGRRVKGSYSRVYCGKGRMRSCKRLLAATLSKAASRSFEDVYGTEGCTLNTGTSASPQMCTDAVDPTDLTAAAVGKQHWINRPTFQQAIEFDRHR